MKHCRSRGRAVAISACTPLNTNQSRVDKPKRALAYGNTLLVNQRQHGAPERRAEAGAANGPPLASPQDDLILAHRRHVREAPAAVVVDLVDPRDVVEAAVDDDLVVGAEGQRGLHLVVVGLDRVPLVVGHPPDVAEAAAAGELGRRDFFEDLPLDRRGRRVRPPQLCAANCEDIGASLGEGWRENGSNVGVCWPTDAAVFRPDAGVAGRKNDGDALQAQLHIFVALAVLVAVGEQIFYGAVRDGDDVGRGVYAALEVALVPDWRREFGVRVYGVRAYLVRTVARLAKGTVGAVATIESVEEGLAESVSWDRERGEDQECGLLFKNPSLPSIS